ncbi:MAG: porin family protein [Lentimicrobiaceae bacterium]|nr:porin family protein [Lentimicrobiaceae bacterium]
MKNYILIFLILLSSTVFSQTAEVGITGGGMYYQGDINPGTPFAMTKPGYGIIVRYNIDTRWALKSNVLFGTLQSDDATIGYKKERDCRFSTSLIETTIQAEVNFLDYFTGSMRTYFSPYIFAGASFFMTDNVTSAAIPFGIGAKYSISKRIGFSAEWGMRKTFTDEIDGLAATYPDGRQLSDSQTNDWFSYAGIGLSYKFKILSRTHCLNSENAYKQ